MTVILMLAMFAIFLTIDYFEEGQRSSRDRGSTAGSGTDCATIRAHHS